MPLGNLTSQFLANVYLAELDNFAKHELKAKYYIRYVDDFVILSRSRSEIEAQRGKIEIFLKDKLALSLHEDKTRIIPLSSGVQLLGFRVFPNCKLLKKSNQNRIWKRLEKFKAKLIAGELSHSSVMASLAGWNGYAKMGNTYKLRQKVMAEAKALFSA